MVVARVALLLHKTPSEIRAMTIEDIDSILHLVATENKKQSQDAELERQKSSFKG